jgi:hypothetical protein
VTLGIYGDGYETSINPRLRVTRDVGTDDVFNGTRSDQFGAELATPPSSLLARTVASRAGA